MKKKRRLKENKHDKLKIKRSENQNIKILKQYFRAKFSFFLLFKWRELTTILNDLSFTRKLEQV